LTAADWGSRMSDDSGSEAARLKGDEAKASDGGTADKGKSRASEAESWGHADADSDSDNDESHEEKTSLVVESLTSKWNAHTEKMVVQLIQGKANVHGRLHAPWDPAFPDYEQTVGSSALHFAARRGLLEVCKALVKHRADVNVQRRGGATPVMVAVLFSQLESIMVLLSARASTMLRDEDGFTALDLAMLEGKPDVVRVLKERNSEEVADREKKLTQAEGGDISTLKRLSTGNPEVDQWMLAGMAERMIEAPDAGLVVLSRPKPSSASSSSSSSDSSEGGADGGGGSGGKSFRTITEEAPGVSVAEASPTP